jgi:hypothetical protein
MPISPSEQGPYLLAAVICERVIEEKDGVKSIFRIVDRLTNRAVGPDPPDKMPSFIRELTLFVSLKPGEARGPHQLGFRMVPPPSDEPAPSTSFPITSVPIHFEGPEDRGIDVGINMPLAFQIAGLYWFEIYLDQSLLTRIPFRVIYLAQRIGPERSPGSHG